MDENTPDEWDTAAMNIKFLKVMKAHQVLYDPSLKDYTSPTSSEIAWNNVSEIMNVSVGQLKVRWKNIRNAYSKSFTKSQRKRYYLAEHMEFLNPFIKLPPIATTSVKPPKKENIHHDSDSEYPEFQFEEDDEFEDEPKTAEAVNKSPGTNHQLDTVTYSYVTPQSESHADVDEDADLLFLKSLLPDIHKMTTSQKHKFKAKTMEAIGDILYS